MASIMVGEDLRQRPDQDLTQGLGFVVVTDLPMGTGGRWIDVGAVDIARGQRPHGDTDELRILLKGFGARTLELAWCPLPRTSAKAT